MRVSSTAANTACQRMAPSIAMRSQMPSHGVGSSLPTASTPVFMSMPKTSMIPMVASEYQRKIRPNANAPTPIIAKKMSEVMPPVTR